ncbi:MAG: hypothetical protein AAGG68_03240 [Bacteroidota bacterium]
MRLFTFIILALFLLACESTEPQVEENTIQRSDLIGVWEQVDFKVTYNTFDEPDSIRVFEVKEENWTKSLSIKPVKTYFLADSTYRQDFIDLNDNVYDTQRGLWNLIGDTLMLISPSATYTYDIELSSNGTYDYSGLLDWDGDGAEDDRYEAKQRLVSRNTSGAAR